MPVRFSHSKIVGYLRGPRLAAVLIVLSIGLSAADQAARTTTGLPHRVLPIADGDPSFDCIVRRLLGLPCFEDMPEPEPDPGTDPVDPLEPTKPLI